LARSSVWKIYAKEMKDILRDRRTVISMVLVPILLMPVMMIGFGAIMSKRMSSLQAETSQIAWIGTVSANEIRTALENRPDLKLITGLEDTTLVIDMLRNKDLDAAILVPDDFDLRLEAYLTDDQSSPPALRLYSDRTREKSRFASDKIETAANAYREKRAEQLLVSRGLRSDLLKPFAMQQVNIVPPEKMGQIGASMMIPYFIIIMVLTGAMYPAIDLTAGEKERGTLETLLVSGVSRLDIVLGKFLTVCTAAVVTSSLSLISMVFSFKYSSSFSPDMSQAFSFNLDFISGVLIFVAMMPLAVIFSAVLMTIALFAKSYREAQSYVSPLMFVVILPAMASLIPDADLSPWMAAIPIMNVSLLLKQAMIGTIEPLNLAITMTANSLISIGSLYLMVVMFRRESVLFRI